MVTDPDHKDSGVVPPVIGARVLRDVGRRDRKSEGRDRELGDRGILPCKVYQKEPRYLPSFLKNL